MHEEERGGGAQSSLSVVVWRTGLQMERLPPVCEHLLQTSPRLESHEDGSSVFSRGRTLINRKGEDCK